VNIEERTIGEVDVLDLSGSLIAGTAVGLLKDKVNSLLQQGRKRIVVNLEHVAYMDSSGLGELVGAYTTVTRNQGALKLLNVTKRNKDLLSITKLLTVFDTFDSESDALKSF
jgi:anti-sigma B factor antagonist